MMEKGKTEFLGFSFTKFNGEQIFCPPNKQIKEEIEKWLYEQDMENSKEELIHLKGKILEYRGILLKRVTEKISQDLLPETFKQLNPDINKYPIKICLEDFDEHFNIKKVNI